jgi:hypothetical protein
LLWIRWQQSPEYADAQGRQLYGIVGVPQGTHDAIITARQQSTTASENDFGMR